MVSVGVFFPGRPRILTPRRCTLLLLGGKSHSRWRKNTVSYSRFGRNQNMPNTIRDINRELAGRINAEARSNPQSPYVNKFVGIANGKVAVVAEDLDALLRLLRQIEADPKNCFFVEA